MTPIASSSTSLQHPGRFRAWFRAARPWTLRAAALPVLVATALAYHDGVFSAFPALCCLLFAVFAQVFANYANDYYDFRKGADTPHRQGPARAVASGWVSPQAMLLGTGLVGLLAFLSGLPLIFYGGWPLLTVGALSLLCAWGYTAGPFPLGYKGLGDAAVVVFFGWIAVTLTHYVQSGSWSFAALIAGTGMGTIANNILVITSARDHKQDAPIGKKTLAVRFGLSFVATQYQANLIIACLCALALAWLTKSPIVALAVLSAPIAWPVSKQLPHMDALPDFLHATRQSARAFLVYGGVMGLGWMV